MNKSLASFARERIKEGLKSLPRGEQEMFKRFYAQGQLELPINIVVENMPDVKLDWALTQVQNSLKKREK